MQNTIMTNYEGKNPKGEYLDLGLAKNYKTKTIQNRWETERQKWLRKPTQKKPDPRDGLPLSHIPADHKLKTADNSMSLRRKVKRTMKSVTAPYEPFESYYPLEDVIDTYMEIWYQSDSSDSSSSWGFLCLVPPDCKCQSLLKLLSFKSQRQVQNNVDKSKPNARQEQELAPSEVYNTQDKIELSKSIISPGLESGRGNLGSEKDTKHQLEPLQQQHEIEQMRIEKLNIRKTL